MRTIKFRGRSVTTGKWVCSMTIAQGTVKRKRDDYFLEVGENEWVGVDKDTIGQFTGLHDSKGVEIYEGDCLLNTECEKIVKFIPELASFCWANTIEIAHELEDSYKFIWCRFSQKIINDFDYTIKK